MTGDHLDHRYPHLQITFKIMVMVLETINHQRSDQSLVDYDFSFTPL